MIRVGIIGGAGYTAGELLRILLNHPEVEIKWVHSSSNAGAHLYDMALMAAEEITGEGGLYLAK
jgi:N-acetyl-gamma-glutamyl-phosphate reductase